MAMAKKLDYEYWQGSPDARMARQQVGTGRSRENFRNEPVRFNELYRNIPSVSGESAVAGTMTTCHRRHNPAASCFQTSLHGQNTQ